MQRKRIVNICFLILIFAILWYGIFILKGEDYYLISMAIIIISLLAFLLSFEKTRPNAAMLTVIASLCALGTVARIAFFFLPQVKPIAAIVIIAGCVFGSEVGFVTGAVSAFVSNFYFGQGAWTPFQMFALGMIGFFAGIFFRNSRNRIAIMIYGFFSIIIIYGGVVDINTIFYAVEKPTWSEVAAIYMTGLPLNITFGISTAAFLFLLYRPIMSRLERMNKKYRLIDKE